MNYPVYLKLTNKCNLKCQHCYNSVVSCNQVMSDETLDLAIDFIQKRAAQLKRQEDAVIVIFHGGEPMMDGVKRMAYVLDRLADDRRIGFTLTTNLVYELTDEKLAFLKQFKQISTSWDWKIRFADSQEHLWQKNVKLLLEEGISIVPIVCLTSCLIEHFTPLELCQKFSSLGLKKMNFERISLTGRADDNKWLRPTNRAVDDWLCECYETCHKKVITVNLLEAVETAVLSNELVGCKLRQCQKTVVTINPDGTLAGCPNTADQAYGSLQEGIDIQRQHACICKEELKQNECYLCKYFKYCNGECFQLQFDETGCPGLKKTMQLLLDQKEGTAQ